MYRYIPKGVCTTEITFEVKEGRIITVKFYNGCSGSLQAISRLVEGLTVDEAIIRLKGIRCGRKDTSCPDQLSRGLEEYKCTQ